MMISTLLLCANLLLAAQPAGQPAIVMDGGFDDWRAIAPALVDPSDAPNAAVDFGELRIAHDDRFVHVLIDFGRNVNVQGLDGRGMILLDVDGEPDTGRDEYGMPGVDVIVDLTPPSTRSPGTPGMGIGLRSTTYVPPATQPGQRTAELNPYDLGVVHSPTHAARRFEFRFNRGAKLQATPPAFLGERFSAKLVFLAPDGSLADETDVVSHELQAVAHSQSAVAEPADDPLARAPGTQLRVMSWNVQRGAMLTQPASFARTVAALRPDLILLQELPERHSADEVRQFQQRAIPLQQGGAWNVIYGSGGGDLRCAVASPLPLREFAPLRNLPLPNQPGKTVRATGAIVNAHGRSLLMIAVHLRCCGRANGPEDVQRLAEAQAIHDAITAAQGEGGIDGVFVAGDFNLVGSREPVEIMAAGADLDHSALSIAPAFQLDGRSNVTWEDASQPFSPGRLDFMLYADSRLRLTGSLVFDSRDLSSRWRETHGVQEADTAASDHLQLVADLGW